MTFFFFFLLLQISVEVYPLIKTEERPRFRRAFGWSCCRRKLRRSSRRYRRRSRGWPARGADAQPEAQAATWAPRGPFAAPGRAAVAIADTVTSGVAIRGRRRWEQAALRGGQMDAFSGFSNYITTGCVLGLCGGGF